jgi:hypothetical protein
MAVQTLLQHYYGQNFGEKCIVAGIFSPIIYVTAFSCIETVLFSICHGTYIAKVVKFNRSKPAPDALSGSVRNLSGSLGLTLKDHNVYDLLYKQVSFKLTMFNRAIMNFLCFRAI